VRGEWPASGNSGPEQVQVDILQPALPTRQGQTLLTNSLGQQTLYTHRIIGGQHRLVQAVGAGCASCGPVNRRWGYDSVGRLTEQTALSPVAVINGQPQGTPQPLATVRHTLDAQGRTVRIERIEYRNGQPHPITYQAPSLGAPSWATTPCPSRPASPTTCWKPSGATAAAFA
jgi:hypothetical protein